MAAEKTQVWLEATLEATTTERDVLRQELAAERADRATVEARNHEQVANLTGKQAHTQGALEATVAERDQLRTDLAEARVRLTDQETAHAQTQAALEALRTERAQPEPVPETPRSS